LVLRARSQSWVQVRDASGAVVLQRNLAAEESVSVNAPTPLAVVVGRADATEVLVRGKPFDLAGVSRENVARFEVK
jgi:cytoskeleton protein RodZ